LKQEVAEPLFYKQVGKMTVAKSRLPQTMRAKMASKKAPNPIDIHVGSRVRLRRMMLSMRHEKLCEHLGITFQQIQ
jgi:hypothetical protein